MKHLSESPSLTSDEANVEQREYWRHAGADQYQENEEANEAVIAPFGQAMLEAARLQPGERVLDVGCGRGASTVEAAECVAPSGLVVGVDISATMLQAARARSAAAGLHNVELLEADAQVHAFDPGSFDVVISRFGVMFFDDPQAAFANLARALRPGGRLHFVCPQDPLKSEWVAVAFGAAVKATGRAPEVGQPGAPGPFAFADGDRLGRLLTRGGLQEPRLESIVRPVRLGTRRRRRGRVHSLPARKPTAVRRCPTRNHSGGQTRSPVGLRAVRQSPWCGDGRLGMARVGPPMTSDN